MSYAVEHGYAILTHDLDFGINLSRSKSSRPALYKSERHDTNPHVIGEQVVQAIKSALKELASGALITVDAATGSDSGLLFSPSKKKSRSLTCLFHRPSLPHPTPQYEAHPRRAHL